MKKRGCSGGTADIPANEQVSRNNLTGFIRSRQKGGSVYDRIMDGKSGRGLQNLQI